MRTVFLDIDTQFDFLVPSGALYVPGAEKLIPTWARLKEYAASNGITVISTMDAHEENDPEFRFWPPHCIAGTLGQRKPEKLLDSTPIALPFRYPFGALPENPRHIIVEKATTDCFVDTHLERVLEHLSADKYVVYGVVTEICVQNAVFGLLRMRKKVELLTDAVKDLDPSSAAAIIREFQASGGGIATVSA